jgi:hypothetical protein
MKEPQGYYSGLNYRKNDEKINRDASETEAHFLSYFMTKYISSTSVTQQSTKTASQPVIPLTTNLCEQRHINCIGCVVDYNFRDQNGD